jgi:toxin-antitoxin system PIN domain toxin
VILPDVNVLVYAHREDSPDHDRYRLWLLETVCGEAPFGLSDLVLSGFLRVVTHPRIFTVPTPLDRAVEFANALREQPNCAPIAPGPRHWDIFINLCRASGAKGSLIADAFLAALAIESGSEWITTDRDYSRFPGLRWRHPLERTS